jgi:hypothetical protein
VKLIQFKTIEEACAEKSRMRRVQYFHGPYRDPVVELFADLVSALDSTDQAQREGLISTADATEMTGTLFGLARQVREIYRTRPAVQIVAVEGKCQVCGQPVDGTRRRFTWSKGESCPACGGPRE